jgi:hypothetical protein
MGEVQGLIARLRQAAVNVLEFVGQEYREESELYRDAADEIERLRKLHYQRTKDSEVIIRQREEFRGLLRDWLAAYDACGPDNGPSLTEHECAEKARKLLQKREPSQTDEVQK